MRKPTTGVWATLLAGLLVAACSPSGGESAKPAADAARAEAERNQAARADALRRLGELEAAIADARQRIAAAEASSALTRQQRLVLSETRRAVVVANVSLQKARTALVASDYATASAATEGAAEKLRSVAQGKSVTSAQQPQTAPR
jgi:hypothetical protein